MSNTISNTLTDLYRLFDKYERGLQPIYEERFTNYLKNIQDPLSFVNLIFTLGFEIRDLEIGTFDGDVETLLNMIKEASEPFKEAISEFDNLQTIYNIGLINLYLYFCKFEETNVRPIQGIETFGHLAITNQPTLATDFNINKSVNYLKLATELCAETMDIAKGIYLYHVIRLFEYIFRVFDNYRVFNDNKPIDLDSFYVFTDQLNSPRLWEELAKQMKIKYNK